MTTESFQIVISETGAARVGRDIGKIGSNAEEASVFLNILRRSLDYVLSYGIIQYFKDSAKSAFDFQTALSRLSIILKGDVNRQLQILSQEAREQAATFGNQPIDEVNSLYTIIATGANRSASAVSVLSTANQFSIASFSKLTDSTKILTSVFNAYGSRIKSVTQISDDLTVALENGDVNTAKLAAEISRLTPIAVDGGVAFKPLIAAITALSRNGINTEEAVVGLGQTIKSIIKPTNQAKKEAAALGISFNQATLQSKGLAGILTEIKARTGGSVSALAQLFGNIQALRVVIPLLNSASGSFAEILGRLKDDLGATADAAKKIEDTPAFQARKFWKALDVEMIKVGNDITSYLVPAMKTLTTSIDDVRKAIVVLLSISAIGIFGGILKLLTAIGYRLASLISYANELSPVFRSFGLIGTFIAGAIAFIDEFGGKIKIASDGSITLKSISIATWQSITGGAKSSAGQIQKVNEQVNPLVVAFEELENYAQKFDELFARGAKSLTENAITAADQGIGALVFAYKGLQKTLGFTDESFKQIEKDSFRTDFIGNYASSVVTNAQQIQKELNQTTAAAAQTSAAHVAQIKKDNQDLAEGVALIKKQAALNTAFSKSPFGSYTEDAQNLAKVLETQLVSAAGSASDSLAKIFVEGKSGFSDLVNVIKQLAEALISAAIQAAIFVPIFKSLGFGFGGSLTSAAAGSAAGAAAGGAASAAIPKPFANGGIVDRPTYLPLAGEKGAEAILPLGRNSSGQLGVKTTGGTFSKAFAPMINITVNSSNNSSNPSVSNAEAQKQASLIANQVRGTVLSIMKDQKRPGGILYA